MARDARIVLRCLDHDRAVFLNGHGAELENREGPAAKAEALLAEQHGPRQIQPDRHRDGGHDRRSDDQNAGIATARSMARLTMRWTRLSGAR